jgi:hypothetical protein
MIIDEEAYLQHFGTKGMRWGVRRSQPNGVSRKTNREASKDAKEFARAKQFYGKGAGTRRKLIKAQVEGKSKHNPAYAKAFESHLSKQDTSKHASKAVSERKRKDVKEKTKQQAGLLARTFTGEMGTQAAFTATALGGAAFLASPKGRQLINKGTAKVKNIADSRAQRQGAKFVADLLKPHQ